MHDDVLARIRTLVAPALLQCGVELFDVQWDAQGTPPVLRLLIDRAGGVRLDDCERASHAVAAVIDAADPVDGPYTLEVSSPGAERPLGDAEDWRRHVGSRVNVRFRSGSGETVLEGRLLAVADDSVDVESVERRRRAPVTVPRDAIVAGRLAVEI